MTTITVEPHILRDVDLKIGTDNYEAHVNRVELAPSTGTVTWQGLTPSASFTGSTASTWVANLSGVQDWETADALAEYLFDHEGEEVPISFRPRRGSGATFTGTVTCVPTSVGGDVSTFPVFAVTLPMSGKPTKVPAV